MDREAAEVWVSRDSTWHSVRAGTVLLEDIKKDGFPECLKDDIRDSIPEIADRHLTTGNERIYGDSDGFMNIVCCKDISVFP